MRIVTTNIYVGPNLYAHFPVIRHVLDLGELEEWPTGRLGAAFNDRLLECLPGLAEHGCSYGEPGGFVRRLTEDEGTWLGHVLEHVAIELQNVAGIPVTFGKTRSLEETGQYWMVYQYADREVGLEAGRLGLELIYSLLPQALRPEAAPGTDWDWDNERDGFIRYAQRRALGPSTLSLVQAAEARDIPWLRLNDYSLIQLGHGRYQQRLQATVSSQTRNIAVDLASDKEETNRILADLGLPVPSQRLVYSDREAARAARRIGFPVVIKPLNANHGRGVTIDVQDVDQVIDAFRVAREHSRGVLIESYITGLDHRILVVDGTLIAAAKRVPGHVIGDGQSTVSQLIDVVNQDPRRGVGHEKVLTRLELDHQATQLLEELGHSADTVPAEGERVFLRRTANLSTGGTAIDVTDVIHPDNRDMAIRAIRAIGLDIGGVDFLTSDITESWKATGGAICEVNAGPGFRMHVAPSEGTPRDVAKPVIDMLFPAGSPSRIPIATITGTNGKTTTTRMTAHILKLSGHTVGYTTTDGVYIDGKLTVTGDMTGPTSAGMILRDPIVDAAVMETARGGMLRAGLGYERCNVAACLNVSSDHLGLRGIDTLDQLAEVKRIPIEIATDAAVLNADDKYCLRMADYTDAENVVYVTMRPGHPLVKEHIRAGGRALVLEEGMNGQMITVYDNGNHMPLLWTHLIPATVEGRALHNVQNAMFAAAICYSMGKSMSDIQHGLRTFDTTFFQTPGRMNIYDEHPFKVILDYGHNPAAVRAMVNLSDRLEVRGRRVVVLAAPGDRRDQDIEDVAREAAGHFDHYICRRDDHLRGRDGDEVPAILKRTLVAEGVDLSLIEVIPDEQDAVSGALAMAQTGDLILVFGDDITRTWKQIIYFKPGEHAGAGDAGSSVRIGTSLLSDDLDFDTEVELVRDERGVRIAKETETED
jgi:cyanophycin synthetase